MPPFLPRKRSTVSPSIPQPPKKKARLADILDEGAANGKSALQIQRSFSVNANTESSSSLSDLESDEFEDIPGTKHLAENRTHEVREDESDTEEDEEEVEWEDAAHIKSPENDGAAHRALANGPIQLTFRADDGEVDYSVAGKGIKKGPSRREKLARINAHKLHVQFLLWHNAIRNAWIGDVTVQRTLVKQLPRQILKEIKKWKRASGLTQDHQDRSETGEKGHTKQKKKNQKPSQRQRDWGSTSQPLDVGKPDLSHGDPIIPLMKVLAAYWKKRFAITAPGLRKRGYGTKQQLKQEIKSHKDGPYNLERHGEKIQDIDHFRHVAEKCEGSRDTGAQLFTALLRGLGIEARMIASLQPTGYGWTKAEHMLAKKPTSNAGLMDSDSDSDQDLPHRKSKSSSAIKQKQRSAGNVPSVISIDSDNGGTNKSENDEDDSDSVIDITFSLPKQRKQKYDQDLVFPIYWTEVISPVTNKILPVSPLVLDNAVASTPEVLSTFEPRGAKAERTHQVMAYVIAHSSDGTAKDVTVRYLRKHIWPGKSKGFRYPIEKIPLYDVRGKLRRYADYDWFKHVMALYERSIEKRTQADDIEESTDLIVAQAQKKEDDGADTLQSLKSSADYVLERFLRREEALRPDAKPVRMFISGKGPGVKEESVFLRADVERCLTAESWHKEGRRPKLGETPMKLVPVRAVTLTRKREAEEHERITGKKQMQGLYSWDQTEWIIPDPIEDGVIPKNSYGNMDCFVPSMVPRGAVHIPLKGTLRICKKLEIDYAEAVTGFEFGNKRAVPVCTGVVVAAEHEALVRNAWQAYNEEQMKKEQQKMEGVILDAWRKFVIGLRIRERVAEQYGSEMLVDEPLAGASHVDPISIDDDADDYNVIDTHRDGPPSQDEDEHGGGFLLPDEDEASERDELVMEDIVAQQRPAMANVQYPTPTLTPTTQGLLVKPVQDPSLPYTETVLQQSADNIEDDKIGVPDNTVSAKSISKPVKGRKRTSGTEQKSKSTASRKQSIKVRRKTSPLTSDHSTDSSALDTPKQGAGAYPDTVSSTESEQYTPRTSRLPRKATTKKNPGASIADVATPGDKDSSHGDLVAHPAVKSKKAGRIRNSENTTETINSSTRSSLRRARKRPASRTSPYFDVAE